MSHPPDEQRLGLEHLSELVVKLLGTHEVADPPGMRMARLAARSCQPTSSVRDSGFCSGDGVMLSGVGGALFVILRLRRNIALRRTARTSLRSTG